MDEFGELTSRSSPVWVGLSLMPEEAFRAAALPLLAAGVVDVLEWSFDVGWGRPLPPWLAPLLTHYSEAGRLLGHGVHYSPLSAAWEERQARWLDALAVELRERSYVHVSEHYGFMTAPPFTRGAPLPLPRGGAALRVGRDRLRRLRERLACPLGLENLAIAFSRDEALAHGEFLASLLEQPDDFIVLDVHNVYCQALNFGLPPAELLASFPLARVAELHISGGSWRDAWPGDGDQVRCDTHDERIPEPLFALLQSALEACPNVRSVVFERLGATLVTASDVDTFRADFLRVREVVRKSALVAAGPACTVPMHAEQLLDSDDADEQTLATFQSALLRLLASESERRVIERRLATEPAFAPFARELSSIDPRALGIASRVARKWLRPRATDSKT